MDIIVTTAFGTEGVTARELRNLGYEDLTVDNGKIIFQGDAEDVVRANMWLRTAARVLIRVGEFKATTFEELFEGVKALPWEEWIPENGRFPVNGKSVQSTLFSISDCQAITKKAIVEKLKQKYHREYFDETGVEYKIEVALLKDIATLTIDTSGLGLHKRGYRDIVGESPLKETMAAMLILLGYWKKGRIFVDPLCGSGTLPIEAAMIAKNIAPGLNRHFAAEKWGNFSPDIWKKAREEAASMIDEDVPLTIFGSDINPKAVELANFHAEKAGVDDCVSFKQMNVANFASKDEYGFIITNPPYGERLGEEREVIRLYTSMGEAFAKLPSWSYGILTSYVNFEKVFGKKSDKKRKLFNGQLLCHYYQYNGPKPPKNFN